jgi:DNA polymerase III delta prime subunit
MLNIHENIIQKLNTFHTNGKIPNILFHGPSGSGKKTVMNQFIHTIFDNNQEKIKDYVLYVNCSHGKGIKFVRDELKFFAKTHVNTFNGNIFKIVVLLNADKLSIDAQSAIRRCIELFSGNTRFFIVVEDKYKLMKPILSRFCEIHLNDTHGNLYKYQLSKVFHFDYKKSRYENIKKEMQKFLSNDYFGFSEKLYNKGFSCLDLLDYVEKQDLQNKYEILFFFNKIKRDIRNEKILIMFLLQVLSSKSELKNVFIY